MNATAITMLDTIVPKSDQLNSDDLIGGPRTIRLTKVHLTGEEQPVALHYEGDDGKPYKPCKSMRRVLVQLWGPDANVYGGRSLTLFRDDKVRFGAMEVGGIRISHMSHIEREITIALTATRGNKKPYTVRPLRAEQPRPAERQAPTTQTPALPLNERADAYEGRLRGATNTTKLHSLRNAAEALLRDLDDKDPERKVELDNLFNERFGELEDAEREA